MAHPHFGRCWVWAQGRFPQLQIDLTRWPPPGVALRERRLLAPPEWPASCFAPFREPLGYWSHAGLDLLRIRRPRALLLLDPPPAATLPQQRVRPGGVESRLDC